jgi:hypothetical protein
MQVLKQLRRKSATAIHQGQARIGKVCFVLNIKKKTLSNDF